MFTVLYILLQYELKNVFKKSVLFRNAAHDPCIAFGASQENSWCPCLKKEGMYYTVIYLFTVKQKWHILIAVLSLYPALLISYSTESLTVTVNK